jgi:hypothetical protein
MFIAPGTVVRWTLRTVTAVVIASVVFALGVTAITTAHVVWAGVHQAVTETLGQADPCATRGMLVDQCAPLDTSRVTDLRPTGGV